MDEEMIIELFWFRNPILLTHPELMGCKNLTPEIIAHKRLEVLFASFLHFLPRSFLYFPNTVCLYTPVTNRCPWQPGSLY